MQTLDRELLQLADWLLLAAAYIALFVASLFPALRKLRGGTALAAARKTYEGTLVGRALGPAWTLVIVLQIAVAALVLASVIAAEWRAGAPRPRPGSTRSSGSGACSCASRRRSPWC
jgi:hypothetical protein